MYVHYMYVYIFMCTCRCVCVKNYTSGVTIEEAKLEYKELYVHGIERIVFARDGRLVGTEQEFLLKMLKKNDVKHKIKIDVLEVTKLGPDVMRMLQVCTQKKTDHRKDDHEVIYQQPCSGYYTELTPSTALICTTG